MAVVKEPSAAVDKDKKAKKKDKKLSVSEGGVKKSHKKAAKGSELDNSAALRKKTRKSKATDESQDGEAPDVVNVDACAAGQSSPSKFSKKKSGATPDSKRKRDTDVDGTPVSAPKKGKSAVSTATGAEDDEAMLVKDAKVPPPALR